LVQDKALLELKGYLKNPGSPLKAGIWSSAWLCPCSCAVCAVLLLFLFISTPKREKIKLKVKIQLRAAIELGEQFQK